MYDTTNIKNDASSFYYDVIIKYQKFCDFASDIEYNSKTDAFRVFSPYK